MDTNSLKYAPFPKDKVDFDAPFQFEIKPNFLNYLQNKTSAQCGSEMPALDNCYPVNFNLHSKCHSQNLWNNSTRRKTVVKDYIIKE